MNPRLLHPDEWERIGTLFDRLCAQPRELRRLDDLGEPDTVCHLLERLLAAHDSSDPLLVDQTLGAVAVELINPTTSRSATLEWAGRRFGPWQADHEIGRGGMALVLKGHRADGKFEKAVAIKLLPELTSAGRERLAEEIRILARLEHPNIARLIDGDVDPEGLPYLVMELVDGELLSTHCASHALDLPARIRLFKQVIRAVIHAHRQLVVHCDIKPANILVSTSGQVRLVDFGIAGLVSSTGTTSPTARGWFCSPAYAAPEQLAGDPPSVGQDIFSLGAVLYELLTDRPLRNNRQATRLWFALDGPIKAPEAPSRIRAGIDADLDAICMQALATDPAARYPSAEALLSDIERWLGHFPVDARAGGSSYRLGKWLRRNHLAASATGLIALALVAGTGLALWQAKQATQARALAELELEHATAMNEFIVGLFENAEISYPRDTLPDTRELLEKGADQARARFSAQPRLKADMLGLIGSLLGSVGLTTPSRLALEEAATIYEQLLPDDDLRLARIDLELGQAFHLSDRFDEAIVRLERAVAGLRRLDQPALLARAQHALGFALSERQAYEPAQALHREALDIQQQLGDETALGMGLATTALGLQRSGDLDASIALYDEALPILIEQLGQAHYRTAMVMSDYGVALRRAGRYDEAVDMLRQAIAASESIYTGAHVTLAQRWNNLGAALVTKGDRPGAAAALEQALQIFDQLESDDVASIIAAPLNNLGFIQLSMGEAELAETYFRRSLALMEASVGRDYVHHIGNSSNLARAVAAQGRLEEAEIILLDAMERASRAFEPGDERRRIQSSLLGQFRWQRSRDPDGLGLIHDAFESAREHYGDHHVHTARYALELAEALATVPDPINARQFYELALGIDSNNFASGHQRVQAARCGLAEVLLAQGEISLAREVVAPLGPLPPADLPPRDPLRARMARIDQALKGP